MIGVRGDAGACSRRRGAPAVAVVVSLILGAASASCGLPSASSGEPDAMRETPSGTVESPTPQSENPATRRSFTVALTGDVLVHTGV